MRGVTRLLWSTTTKVNKLDGTGIIQKVDVISATTVLLLLLSFQFSYWLDGMTKTKSIVYYNYLQRM